ncbi:MAG TPA: DNA-processing protein DprA [Nitrospirales bacterium]|nr:DNA-protecting protein DprA [Nitrospiraceae bacterium]HNP31567.1 DNA-processing protein DprA [Nitrospirales bacterium]
MTTPLLGWLELLAVPGLGPVTYTRLINRFCSPEVIRSMDVHTLVAKGEISPSLARAIHQPISAEAQDRIAQELQAVQDGQFTILTLADAHYPPRLKTITDPPPVLWCTGKLQDCDHQALAIVGSRKGSHIGRTFTRQLSGDLAALGFTIVSGLARGIDAAAHEGALSISGRTLAVLGCGIDRIYPPEHAALRHRIEQQGAVLSEFPMGTAPHAYHFPQRNRVISGLSLGVIVAEATSRSGSLITARMALEQNREVFAVPGNVTNTLTRGPHRLIKEGAKLVESSLDVVEEILPMLEPSFRDQLEKQQGALQPQPSVPALGPEEQRVFDCLSLEPVSLDDLISQGSSAPSEVMSILLSLEIKGLITQIPGLQYVRMSIR